jgi:cytochrome c oxidase assembly protein Cox11
MQGNLEELSPGEEYWMPCLFWIDRDVMITADR